MTFHNVSQTISLFILVIGAIIIPATDCSLDCVWIGSRVGQKNYSEGPVTTAELYSFLLQLS